jgi:hypothetical protein
MRVLVPALTKSGAWPTGRPVKAEHNQHQRQDDNKALTTAREQRIIMLE